MKSIWLFLILVTLAFSTLASGWSKTQQNANETDMMEDSTVSLAGKKVLIVYLSRTNNTRAVAQIIQREVGGKMVALELVIPYPQNYKAIVAQVARENETGFLPPLKTKIDSIGSYDVIFVGFPTWGMQLPPPMKSFLKQYDLGGKTIVPFNTNAGYGIGSTFETVKQLSPNSKVTEGFTIKGGIERDSVLFVMKGEKEKQARIEVKAWLGKIAGILE